MVYIFWFIKIKFNRFRLCGGGVIFIDFSFGLILYSIGSKAIPAAELTLLSLTEIIGGIFWVWLPFFGINEEEDTDEL